MRSRERDLVIGAMLEEGYITAAEARNGAQHDLAGDEAAAASRASCASRTSASACARRPSASSDRSRASPIGALAVRTGGYRITTTLDYELQQEAKRLVGSSGCHPERLQREQLGAGGDRLGDRRDRRLRRQRRLLQPRGSGGPGPVRRGRPRPAPAGIGLQADHVRVGLQVARRDRRHDARGRHDRVRDRRPRRRTGRRTPTSRSTARSWRSTRCATR